MARTSRDESSTRHVKRHQPYNSVKTIVTLPKGGLESASDSSFDSYTKTLPRKVSATTARPKASSKSRRLQDIQDALSEPRSANGASTSTSPPCNTTSFLTPRETVRDVCLEGVRKRYSFYTPKNDFEILSLNDGLYKGTSVEGIVKYLENDLKEMTGKSGNPEFVFRRATKCLDAKADFTGLKPRPGDFGVFIQPIPDSDYSVRLFPGSKYASEYCLDFVLTATGEPENSPFEFSLFAGPGPTVPLGTTPTVGLRPLECSFGIPIDKIPPGTEKFLLRDGQLCTLRRPGHKDVQFTIPIRQRAEPPKPDVNILEFPQFI
ncbi:hypothetical protein C2E23DRAFT_798467 [Lenzites betulinus]|nr:hypothetical protein C2E23DRAFT_798467 [Lenzites betulinus]